MPFIVQLVLSRLPIFGSPGGVGDGLARRFSGRHRDLHLPPRAARREKNLPPRRGRPLAIQREFASWRTVFGGYPSNSMSLRRLREFPSHHSFRNQSNLRLPNHKRLTGTFSETENVTITICPPMPPNVPGSHESTLKGRAGKDPPSARSLIPK